MADLTDVENALAALILTALYPNGTGQASVANVPIKIYPGWPTSSQLDADLAVGTAHVTIFPTASERNTTRYPDKWETLSVAPATLTLAINGQQITVGGAMPSPFSAHNLVLMVTGKIYSYAVQSTDTLTSIATALTALLAVDYAGATSTGAVITLPNAAHITAARIGTLGTSIREVRRQEREFQITAWCDTPAHRDAIVKPMDIALAATKFLALADGTAARLIYKSSPITDAQQKSKLYRRDLIYTVEYATTQTATNMQIVASQSNISNQPTGATAPLGIFTLNL